MVQVERAAKNAKKTPARPVVSGPVAAGPSDTGSAAGLLGLQRSAGNRALVSTLSPAPSGPATIRRMPTATSVRSQMKEPRRFGSTKYRTALEALSGYDRFLETVLAPTGPGIIAQLKDLLRRYDDVINACKAYGSEKGKKAAFFGRLQIQAQNEKTAAIGAMMRASENPGRFSLMRPKILFILRSASIGMDMDEARYEREVGGGMAKLQQYSGPGGGKEFFKENMETMDVWTPQESNEFLDETLKPERTESEQNQRHIHQRAKDNRSDFAEMGGISATDTHSAAREVATTRLDVLLDAGVIARTRFALRNVGGKSVLGSVQAGSSGLAAGKSKVVANQDEQNQIGPDESVNAQDPNLMRLASRLEVLDALAMQMDRHTGNYFIETDQQGQVVRVTGIDNDMSFGTRTDVNRRAKQYEGLSLYVDSAIAEKVIALDPELLRLAMTDLLSPPELDALSERLGLLRAHLTKLQTEKRLLSPQQWDAAVAQGLLDNGMGHRAVIRQRAENRVRDNPLTGNPETY